MNKAYLLAAAFFIINAYADNKLKFQKVLFNRDDTEISGLALKDNELLFVGDKLSDRRIYKVRFENDRFFSKDYIDISKLDGHGKYFAEALLFKHGGRVIKSPFDLEGISYCGNDFYLANEQTRHILKVNNEKIENLKIEFSEIFKKFGTPLKDISTNAGFEGLTVDCKNKILYIAQERQPRAIIVVDLKTLTTLDIFDTPGVKVGKVSPDYADLFFQNGYLYALERNFHRILKIDPSTKKVIANYSYGHTNSVHLKNIYDTNEPYGLAEGLTMSDELIYIGVDNNKNKMSATAQEKFGISGNFSSIMIYKRPKGF